MGRLEAINGNCSVAIIDSNGEVFGSSLYYRIWAIIGWLEGFTNSIVTDKHVCGFCKFLCNVGGLLCVSR